MSTPHAFSEHMLAVRKAQLALNDYRKAICAAINDRLRMLQKHERDAIAKQIDGQLDLDIEAIAPSPELARAIADPTGSIT